MYQDIDTSFFRQLRQIKEAKRDPLAGIDKLAIPDTMVHGQSLRGPDPSSSKNIDTSPKKDDKGHGQSDADTRTDSEQSTPPKKGASVDDPLLKGQKTSDSILETLRKQVESEKKTIKESNGYCDICGIGYDKHNNPQHPFGGLPPTDHYYYERDDGKE